MPRSPSMLVVMFALVVPVGTAGTWAFNPDSGALLHSEVLWRIFGVMAEGGLFLIAVLLVLSLLGALATLIWAGARKLLN